MFVSAASEANLPEVAEALSHLPWRSCAASAPPFCVQKASLPRM